MLPPEAQDHERIRVHLNSALNAMNSAVEGVPLQYVQPGQAAAAGAGYGYAGAAGALLCFLECRAALSWYCLTCSGFL